ncbi:MAG: hypothetical protein KAI17_17430, partial [Thiotrichaceae bacterium]|nr:hypothetical protein [Thiotrichaceae bacterium]
MVTLKQLLFLLALLVCSMVIFIPDAMAEVTASTGRTVLTIDESIMLQIKSNDSSGDPELSVLDNNFKVLNKSQSQN